MTDKNSNRSLDLFASVAKLAVVFSIVGGVSLVSADAAAKKRVGSKIASVATDAKSSGPEGVPEKPLKISELGEKLSERVQKILHSSGFKNGELGVWIGTKSDIGFETYFSQNGDKSFIPASLSKIVTMGAVFHTLHPGYKYKTFLLGESSPREGVLKGPIYLKGGGDPSFVSENMWFLVNELTRAGVTRVDGDVIVDDSRFDTIRFGEDRQSVRVDRAYDAPIGAMSMNWNSATVYIRPGDKPGDKLKVFADVMSPYLKVKNETRTVAVGRGKNLSVERVNEAGFDGDVIVVSGSMAADQPEAIYYKSISRPDVWAGHNLIEFLKQRGVSVGGKVRSGVAPKTAVVLATEESKPFSAVVADMAKWSNNYVAEMLVKNLSAEAGDTPGTMAGGLSRVQQWLENIGLKKGEYEFINAAGFTRENRLTPVQLGRILEAVRGDFTLFPEYLTALPIAGVDGTLKNRMKKSSAERWVRAKTGLLNGVVGLAGFAGRPNGVVVTFAFIYNGAGREDRARALFDQLASSLVEE
jgi:D-alanyl-D-alanine carboxypeptidase/D-alanyl-D-alanine-endopeptidase (penicillin-binding protein 4)